MSAKRENGFVSNMRKIARLWRVAGGSSTPTDKKHLLGTPPARGPSKSLDRIPVCELEPERLLAAVARVCNTPREDFYGTSKSAPAIMAKEMLIPIGLQMGASMKLLSEINWH